jgi:hypothetical protein
MLRVELEVVVLMEHEFAKCAALEGAQLWGQLSLDALSSQLHDYQLNTHTNTVNYLVINFKMDQSNAAEASLEAAASAGSRTRS